MFDTLDELKTAMGVSPSGPPYNPTHDETDEFNTGPYLTFADFYSLVHEGALGPDEDCYWVSIHPCGSLIETPIKHPDETRPARTICVAYYAA